MDMKHFKTLLISLLATASSLGVSWCIIWFWNSYVAGPYILTAVTFAVAYYTLYNLDEIQK